eukprot:1059733-Lingulodinium_polyedra.AAC.1
MLSAAVCCSREARREHSVLRPRRYSTEVWVVFYWRARWGYFERAERVRRAGEASRPAAGDAVARQRFEPRPE